MKEIFLFFTVSFISLFSVVNPLMAVPIFVSLTQKYSDSKRIQIAKKAGIYILGILLTFFIAGDLILNFFGISIEGIRIAGGLMIMNNAIGMIRNKAKLDPEEQQESEEKEDIAFSPLAMPLQSGPGSIAVIIGMTSDAHLSTKPFVFYPVIICVILAVAICCFILMRISHTITQKVSTTALQSFSKIMGFLLLCVGVQYIINGTIPLLEKVFSGGKL